MIQNPSLEPCSFSCLMDLRSGFHRAALPFKLRGIGGPGAPHSFEFCEESWFRLAACLLILLSVCLLFFCDYCFASRSLKLSGVPSEQISNKLWNTTEHPDDVILRLGTRHQQWTSANISKSINSFCPWRCKQWMSSPTHSLVTLLYPRQVGLDLLPFGLPQGRWMSAPSCVIFESWKDTKLLLNMDWSLEFGSWI